MKKVGIITFHASHNCGSMLQAYALQEIIKNKYGCKVEIIDFSNYEQRNLYGLVDFRLKKSAVKNTLQKITHLPTVISGRHDYEKFLNTYFNLSTEKFRKTSQLDSLEGKYDVLVAGGDQVWNVRCDDSDLAYFLSFAHDAKKVAFSPSLGATNINKYAKDKELYKNLLLDFDGISVREKNGQIWLQELLGKDVPIIADPTMLLSAEEWCQSLPVEDIHEKYIFYYAFSYHNKANLDNIRKVSEKTGMPVYVIDGKQYRAYGLKKYGFKLYKSTGPLAFLALMKNAELVFSQSFHGTIFAAMFNRNFWAFHNSTIKNPDDDRATYILNQLGLDDRYINIEHIDTIDIWKEYDFPTVKENIKKLQKDAFDYLEKNINE